MAKKADYALAKLAWCPEECCGVLPGMDCKTTRGLVKLFPHAKRVIRARKLQAGTLQLPVRPGEFMPTPPEPDAEQLDLVGYAPEQTEAG